MGLTEREKIETSLPEASQTDMEDAGKQNGQNIDEVNESQKHTQINRSGLI